MEFNEIYYNNNGDFIVNGKDIADFLKLQEI